MINESALKAVMTQMYRHGIAKSSIRELYGYFKQAKVEELVSVNPNYIAVRTRMERYETLQIVIRGILDGLFEMRWDLTCPKCGEVADHSHSLNAINEQSYCDNCQVHFDNYADQNITVTISLHPGLFEDSIPPQLQTFKSDARLQPITALDLIGLPEFRKNFNSEIPTLDHSVKIRQVTIMFTDLIHSTALYSSIGDLSAYALIKEHFDILFEKIVTNSGGVIKTIGDAVMAVFKEPLSTIQASFEIKKAVNEYLSKHTEKNAYGVRIGISMGPALIVNMNNALDLFGTTVNLASRLVSFAGHDSIAATTPILNNLEVQKYLAKESLTIKTLKEKLKGINGVSDIHLLEPEPK